MQLFSAEREYLIAAADELEDYLLSGASTWRLAGPDSFPPLSPGYILLFKKRLADFKPSDGEKEKILQALDHIQRICLRWNSAWQKRVTLEIPQRLRLWSIYLGELSQARNRSYQTFAWSVRWRVMIAVLMTEVGGLDVEINQQLAILDEQLRSIAKPGTFIWEKNIEINFDPGDYWYLYLQISQMS